MRRQIAVGALRYFMLKFTRNTVIAFDFREALSFEGETGPYVQYAVVRARNILRKGGMTRGGGAGCAAGTIDSRRFSAAKRRRNLAALVAGVEDELLVEQCIATAEPAYLAKHAFQLAQEFNNFYHKHHILHERMRRGRRFCWPRRRLRSGSWCGRWDGWGSMRRK